jgi:hypothetical protein
LLGVLVPDAESGREVIGQGRGGEVRAVVVRLAEGKSEGVGGDAIFCCAQDAHKANSDANPSVLSGCDKDGDPFMDGEGDKFEIVLGAGLFYGSILVDLRLAHVAGVLKIEGNDLSVGVGQLQVRQSPVFPAVAGIGAATEAKGQRHSTDYQVSLDAAQRARGGAKQGLKRCGPRSWLWW